ncbi:50S rRNA methyltransferase [Saccharobesus litoralis]|uniref:50S rRNA methyltransferase n=1 Tax=Saccharobesus litoralis TaxID=2172099 RepID=A0A2S0VUX5_9ALTE|nr:methyltransferase [Saccharobesus litoralis]AWB68026.1 50S rRNA methyltransferase [Saccharobesus litoralis]
MSNETILALHSSQQSQHEPKPASQVELWRYPPQLADANLRAWDAADKYVLQQILDGEITLGNTLLINDAFGALAVSLHQLKTLKLIANIALYSYTDSKVSELALKNNLTRNWPTALHTETNSSVHVLSQTQAFSANNHWQSIIIKLPKSVAYLEFLLIQLVEYLRSSGKTKPAIIIASKAVELTPSIIKLLKSYFKQVVPSRIKQKARYLTLLDPVESTPVFSYWSTTKKPLNGVNYTAAPNVFARGKIDIGGRFLAENLPNCNQKSVIDLGCGNGLLSVNVLQAFTPSLLIASDESAQAVETTLENINNTKDKQQSQTVKVNVIQDDCLTNQASNSADVILCNPPFHQANAVTDHIAWQMFNDAKRVLKVKGELRIVGNRHLGYHTKLKRIFGNCKNIASNDKFVILAAFKINE